MNNLEQPFIGKMRQTHTNCLTYRYNEQVTNEFLCKTVLRTGSWNPWPHSRKLLHTRYSGRYSLQNL